MANNDWNPDDLLDFHYDHPVPAQNKGVDDLQDLIDSFEKPKTNKNRGLDDSFDSYSEMKRYEEIRKQSRNSADSFSAGKKREPSGRTYEPVNRAPEPVRPSPKKEIDPPVKFNFDPEIEPPLSSRSDDSFFEEYDRLHADERRRPQEAPEAHAGRSSKDIAAIKKASQDAYDRYRSNYTKKQKKMTGKVPYLKFHRFLTVVYVLALGAFVGSVTLMNVLPLKMELAFIAVLALLSLIILFQTRRPTVKKWGRRFATLLAILLIGVYGVGTVYALGTMSFLDSTSVENDKAVPIITRDPFNVVITGIDVRGTIDEQGRSDVNMIVTVNPQTNQVLMTSIPRDYQIYMPDKDNAMDKLTHTGFYSVQTTTLAEEDLLDITANYYVKVNFTTVEKFIDAIGGIDVYSEYEFTPVKMKDWTVKEGMNHMNGKQALAFARERKAFVTGDNQRIKNQQAVFEAMIKKATSSRTMLFSYAKILNSLKDYFEMSFSSKEIRSIARMQLAKNPDWKIFKNTITGGDGSLPTYTTGGAYCYVMTQDEESIENAKTLINAVMNGQALGKDEDDKVIVAPSEEE